MRVYFYKSKTVFIFLMSLLNMFTISFNIKELFQLMFHGEKDFPFQRARKFLDDHFMLGVQLSIAYAIIIFSIKRYLKNGKPFILHYPLIAWNAFLSIFSIVAALKMFPYLLERIYTVGFVDTCCNGLSNIPSHYEYWMFLTVLSKFAEFIDTIFIVLRKKPLIFLHWYHHIVTFLFFCAAYPTASSQLRYAAVVNLFVHSFMYPYYLLRALHIKVSGYFSRMITVFQLIQFVLFITGSTYLIVSYTFGNYTCDAKINQVYFSSAISISLFILFSNFFLKSYIIKGGKEKYKIKST